MKNLIITTISLCMNVFVLFLMFNIINTVKHESQERASLLSKKNCETVGDLEDETTNLNKISVCVVFKDAAYKNELLNKLQMCLEDLEEEGCKYKLVDWNLEITI